MAAWAELMRNVRARRSWGIAQAFKSKPRQGPNMGRKSRGITECAARCSLLQTSPRPALPMPNSPFGGNLACGPGALECPGLAGRQHQLPQPSESQPQPVWGAVMSAASTNSKPIQLRL